MKKTRGSRPVQKFSKERLTLDQAITPEQALAFVHEFQQLMAGDEGPRKLISLRVPERLLEQFRAKAERQGVRYQTQLIALIRQWLRCPPPFT